MGVSVFVMPLRTWLAGDFRTTWGPGGETASEPRRRRTAEDAERLRDGLLTQLEPLLGRRPEWDEDGPARSATAFSVYSFSLPFLLARRWSYRFKLPQLSALEGTQLWIPAAFDTLLHLSPPWNEEGELAVASLPRLGAELNRLLEALEAEESLEGAELLGAFQVGQRLRALAASAEEVCAPLIVEG